MVRQRDELVPVAEALADLSGPVKAIRDATTPQARHHFTLSDQVNALVGASEADPDLGFMARLLTLCSIPPHQPRQPASVCRGYDSNGAKSNAKGCRLVSLAVSVRLRGGPRPSRSGTYRRG